WGYTKDLSGEGTISKFSSKLGLGELPKPMILDPNLGVNTELLSIRNSFPCTQKSVLRMMDLVRPSYRPDFCQSVRHRANMDPSKLWQKTSTQQKTEEVFFPDMGFPTH